MSDTNEPPAPVDPIPPPAPVKPGLYTTEFWMGLAAKLLGAAYAGGLIGDGGTVARLAGLAVVVLTYLGYAVNRGLVKAAAATILLGLLAPAQLACSSPAVQQVKSEGSAAAAAVIDCEKKLAPGQLEAGLVQLALDAATYVLPGGGPDWGKLAELAISDATDLKTCALAEYHAVTSATTRPAGPAALASTPAATPLAAAVQQIKRARGVAAIVTPGGTI